MVSGRAECGLQAVCKSILDASWQWWTEEAQVQILRSRGQIFSPWLPRRLTRKQECLAINPPASVLYIVAWSLSSVITFCHIPAWASMAFSVLWPTRAGMIGLCLLSSHTSVTHSRTLCSSPTGLLFIQGTCHPLSCPQVPFLCLEHVCTCARTCAYIPSFCLTPYAERQFPERALWSRLLGFTWLPHSLALCPWASYSPLPHL